MTFQHIPNPPEGATNGEGVVSPEEMAIWRALDGEYGPDAQAEAEAIMDERIAAEDAMCKEAK